MQTPSLRLESIDDLLAYLPWFERSDVRHYELRKEISLDPYIYSSDLLAFVRMLSETGFIVEFDWSSWMRGAGKRYVRPEAVAAADLETLRRLLTAFVRSDRFCSGQLASLIDRGLLVAILRRLAELREEIGGVEKPPTDGERR